MEISHLYPEELLSFRTEIATRCTRSSPLLLRNYFSVGFICSSRVMVLRFASFSTLDFGSKSLTLDQYLMNFTNIFGDSNILQEHVPPFLFVSLSSISRLAIIL